LKIFSISGYNPLNHSSASSNRFRSLVEGKSFLNERLTLFVYASFGKDRDQKKHYQWRITSLASVKKATFFSIRFHNYIGQFLEVNKQKKAILHQLPPNEEFILWIDNSLLSSKVVYVLKKSYPKAIIFTEMSEFLDIHKYNKGNFLQRGQGDIKQKRFEKKVFHQLDGLALMTDTLMKHYDAFPEPKPKMLHLPMTVDLDRFEGGHEKLPEFEGPYIAYVGVMNDAKDGVSILIQAFEKIKNKFPQHKLYLVGAWNYDTPTHLKLIEKYGLKNRVFWMKEYSREQIPQILCNADLLVLPRPDSKQAQGGFPTKLGEYLATGNPVCATTVGEIPNYLADNESVFFAKPGSIDSFAHSMELALCNPENAKRIGLNGKAVAQKEFNKDIQSEKLYQFLLELQKSKNDH
jgi:glycosyltransferase involved in cell wall biosynthesis